MFWSYTTRLFIEECAQASLACNATPQTASLVCLSNQFFFTSNHFCLEIYMGILQMSNKAFKQQQSMFRCTYAEWRWYSSNISHGKFSEHFSLKSWNQKRDKFRLSNSKPKLLLYNSNTGTQMIDCSVSFKYEKTSVKLDIFSKTPDETCYWEIIVGERTKESFKWYTKKRTSA